MAFLLLFAGAVFDGNAFIALHVKPAPPAVACICGCWYRGGERTLRHGAADSPGRCVPSFSESVVARSWLRSVYQSKSLRLSHGNGSGVSAWPFGWRRSKSRPSAYLSRGRGNDGGSAGPFELPWRDLQHVLPAAFSSNHVRRCPTA